MESKGIQEDFSDAIMAEAIEKILNDIKQSGTPSAEPETNHQISKSELGPLGAMLEDIVKTYKQIEDDTEKHSR